MRKLSFILTSMLAITAHAELPAWITSGRTPDADHVYIVCSAEGLDPQNIQQIAESNCLASAAKLHGVTVTIRAKIVQGLSGVDSNEVAQITPLQATVKCEWSHRYLEPVGTSYRLWLECQVDRKSLSVQKLKSEDQASQNSIVAGHTNALVTIATVPRADVIAVLGANGERVINPATNTSTIEVRSGDVAIEARKIGYADQRKSLPNFTQGDSLTMSFRFERDR